MQHVLITGGAGFIGSYVVDQLLSLGCRVRVLDSLCAQVHPQRKRPSYLSRNIELIRGDIRDPLAVQAALRDVDSVVHLVAAVGVGQSMYEVVHYTDVNNCGTAVLMEALTKAPVSRLVVASSMSVYGEGLYETDAGSRVERCTRSVDQLREGRWEPEDECGQPLRPLPTSETKLPSLSSVYALSKYDQECMCLLLGRAYGIPTVALRFFNVYGPRQALSNPYTGVLAIFASRLLNGRPPLIFEDGRQRRDFVSVHDVARACCLALTQSGVDYTVINVGSGRAISIADLARKLAAVMEKDIEPEITGQYRVGDIRHCFADISRARKALDYEPLVSLEEGMDELARWLEGVTAEDRAAEAHRELMARGLAI